MLPINTQLVPANVKVDSVLVASVFSGRGDLTIDTLIKANFQLFDR